MNINMRERCRRICKDSDGQCVINDQNQISCIADMVINHVYGISSIIEEARSRIGHDDALESLDEALMISNDLVNWVRYLQMTRDISRLVPNLRRNGDKNKRRECRYVLPDRFRDFITLKVRNTSSDISAVLTNFSQRGMQFYCSELIADTLLIEGVLLSDHVVRKTVDFEAEAKYYKKHNGGFIVGAEITRVSNMSDFNFFVNVFDLLKDIEVTTEQ